MNITRNFSRRYMHEDREFNYYLYVFFVIMFGSIFYALAKSYIKLSTGWCYSLVCLKGKTVIVTGSNTGIGLETAKNFAMRGARVILACRNESKALEARDLIVKETHNPEVFIKILDLESFASVRRFVEDFRATEDRLDILVNNAGMLNDQLRISEDGISVIMQVNYFSPVLLTLLLLDMLKQSSGRIVNVSSRDAQHISFSDDLTNLTRYTGNYRYARSKLCNILFTIELAERLKETGVTTYSLHPGVVKTNFSRNLHPVFQIGVIVMIKLFFKSPMEGAQTSIYCAVTDGIEKYSGEHFHDCRVVRRYRHARDQTVVRRVWKDTMDVLKID